MSITVLMREPGPCELFNFNLVDEGSVIRIPKNDFGHLVVWLPRLSVFSVKLQETTIHFELFSFST